MNTIFLRNIMLACAIFSGACFAHGPKKQPLIGVSLSPLDLDYLIENESEGPFSGVRVVKIIEGSPGERAGLQAGDIIRSVGKLKASNFFIVVRWLEKQEFGKPLPITYFRDGKIHTTEIILNETSVGQPIRPENILLLSKTLNSSLSTLCQLSYLRPLREKDSATGFNQFWLHLSREEMKLVIGSLYAKGLSPTRQFQAEVFTSLAEPPTVVPLFLLPDMQNLGRPIQLSDAPCLGILDSSFVPDKKQLKDLKPVPFDGVLVTETWTSHPRLTPRIKRGDIITHIDGERVVTFFGLMEKVSSKKVGDMVEISALRNQKEQVFTARLKRGGSSRFAYRPSLNAEIVRLLTTYRTLSPSDKFEVKEIHIKDWSGKLESRFKEDVLIKMAEAKVLIEGFDYDLMGKEVQKLKLEREEGRGTGRAHEVIESYDSLIKAKLELDKAATKKK